MSIRYNNFFRPVRQLVKEVMSRSYPFVIKAFPLPDVRSIEETLDEIVENKRSIGRYGDGEFLYLIDKLELPFQRYDQKLATKLKEILVLKDEEFMVGLPIGYHSMNNLTKSCSRFWKCQIAWIYPRLKKYLKPGKVYYNASMTRVYSGFEDRSVSDGYFKKVMKIWEGRDVLLIEGEKSRLGVGNNLFSSAKSLKRVLAPKHNAFDRYEDLYAEALKHDKSILVLLALGPTATALSYDLYKAGYHTIDIGNVDIEYEWFLRGATKKIVIEGKYTSEVKGGRNVDDVEDPLYASQIIARYL